MNIRKFVIAVSVFSILLAAAAGVNSQTWNSNAGGYNTGYGTVYGTFGLAQATQNMYNTMQMQMQKNIMRQAMIKKWGLAAVEKAEREARGGSSSNSGSANSRSAGSTSGPVVEPRPIPKNYGVFSPDATVDTGRTLANALGDTPDEKKLIASIYTETKAAFEKEAAAKGWKNNIAGALTFFIVGTSTVYHDVAEPSDDAVEVLYQAINQTIDEVPEFGTMSNHDKQGFYNTLIGFTGIALATYTEGKQNGDAATVKTAGQLAAMLINIVLKTDPEKIRYEDGQMRIGSTTPTFAERLGFA